MQRQSAGVLTVSTSPNFASKWLVHRLARFATAHPGIDLRISASLHHVDFAREEVDLAIRHGDGQDAGLHVTRLRAEELVVVCNPKLCAGKNALRKPADLARHTLLHINDRRDWQKWFDAAGVKAAEKSSGPIFNQASMAIDAAVDGQGVALARSALVSWDLNCGRLVQPFALALPVPYAYWIVCPNATMNLPKIVLFREWLLDEVKADFAVGERGCRPGVLFDPPFHLPSCAQHVKRRPAR